MAFVTGAEGTCLTPLALLARDPSGKVREFVSVRWIDTPWGPLTLMASGTGLLKVSWGEVDVEGEHASRLCAGEAGKIGQAARIVEAARDQLCAYLAGQRRLFDVPLVLSGTPFQVAVWEALRALSYGATWSYGELARHLGRPHAARAVGAALRKNPIGIIVPCHRVIGADGSLVGYAGGLEKKRWLLDLERQTGSRAPDRI